MNDEQEYLLVIANASYAKRTTNRSESLTLQEASEQSGITIPTLGRLELAGGISLNTFRKLCLWLKADANELLGLTKEGK